MTINLDTLLVVTAVQSLLLSAAIIKRDYVRPEAWLLVGLVASVFFYIAFKMGVIGLANPELNLLLAPVAASETLPGALIIAYTLNVLFQLKSRRIYWVLLLPLAEVLITWGSLAAFGNGSATAVSLIMVRLGQIILFAAGAHGIWLARKHMRIYEAQSSDNRRIVGLLLILPAAAMLALNAVWLLTELNSAQFGGRPGVNLTIISMISTFQVWLLTFLLIGADTRHKPLFDLAPVEVAQSAADDAKLVEDFSRICEVLQSEKLYLDPELSLAKLSRKVAMNRSWVSQVINAQEGLSFSLLINTMRVEHAKSLLLDADLSVLEIAFESGFNSKSTFNRVFKDLTGETPRNWRTEEKAAGIRVQKLTI